MATAKAQIPSFDGERERPRVVIVGGGFGGLAAARALKGEPVEVVLVDRRNHHLFQPLLYQVATAALAPANIAMPIRRLFRRQPNALVLLGEVTDIDVDQRRVLLEDGTSIPYDYLVLAAGARHSYFGHAEWERLAPGLKSIEDALEIRRRFLVAFERAERAQDPEERSASLTFVVVGGGPTGVELAGAMAEIARRTIPKDYRRIDTSTARVILVEGLDRLLSTFDEALSRRAKRDLEALGVEVRLRTFVTEVEPVGVVVRVSGGAGAGAGDGAGERERGREGEAGGEHIERIASHNVIWAAGVQASPLGRMVSDEVDRAGRVKVAPDLSVPGHPEVFCIGDMAAAESPAGRPVPGMAQGAIQGGRHVGTLLRRELRALRTGRPPPPRRPFRYRDKGAMAVIGRNRAVAEIRGARLGGWLAWLVWAGVHIAFLIGFRNKLFTLLEWGWMYLFRSRGSRLITETPAEVREESQRALPPPAPEESRPTAH